MQAGQHENESYSNAFCTWAAFIDFDVPTLFCQSDSGQATYRACTDDNSLPYLALFCHYLLEQILARTKL